LIGALFFVDNIKIPRYIIVEVIAKLQFEIALVFWAVLLAKIGTAAIYMGNIN